MDTATSSGPNTGPSPSQGVSRSGRSSVITKDGVPKKSRRIPRSRATGTSPGVPGDARPVVVSLLPDIGLRWGISQNCRSDSYPLHESQVVVITYSDGWMNCKSGDLRLPFVVRRGAPSHLTRYEQTARASARMPGPFFCGFSALLSRPSVRQRRSGPQRGYQCQHPSARHRKSHLPCEWRLRSRQKRRPFAGSQPERQNVRRCESSPLTTVDGRTPVGSIRFQVRRRQHQRCGGGSRSRATARAMLHFGRSRRTTSSRCGRG